jgi:hypothetical protein
MHNPANDTAIIHSLNTTHVCRQMRLNPLPLLITQPKEVLAHDPDPPKNESGAHRIRIALSQQQN